MNYASIKPVDIANGPGVRVSLFVSGCTHHCKGCFNQETWDFNFGSEFTQNEIEYILSCAEPNHISGLTVLGGEPLEPQNQSEVLNLIRQLKNKHPEKSVWLYTGYLFDKDVLSEKMEDSNRLSEILKYVDVVVDGPYIESKSSLKLLFRGSDNQRIIDVKESLQTGKIVLWNEK